MTDLNKLRSEFESDLANHLIERDVTGTYFNDEIQNEWEKHLLKAQIKELKAALEKDKAQAVPETKPIAYKVSFDSWQKQHGKDYFEFWNPDEFEDYKPDYLIPLYSFPTISSDFVVVPKEPTQKMLNAAHCYMNPVKGSDVHPETNRKRKEMYKAMIKASESGAEG
ncbi:hypothetical protein ACINNAV83_2817 [Acinetobacter baumannii Naval-83]|nr:hypothetical protein [Acinetobacter baumannii]EKL50691.1 hypothetical protein ACINNAV83_2817 [Acinetobacter baumannii Naval-83]KZA12997.1 hypothetical protein LV36_02104 [Acinetobacter baumannii]